MDESPPLTFRQRLGLKPVRSILQVDSIDEPLKNALWDWVMSLIGDNSDSAAKLRVRFWTNFLRRSRDTLPQYGYQTLAAIRAWFFAVPWYDVYEAIEFFLKGHGGGNTATAVLNHILARDMAGYRVIDQKITPIIDQDEIDAVQTAATSGPSGAKLHLSTAIRLMSARDKPPDYRNSVKESILAVEAAARDFTGDDKATLPDAIRIMKAKRALHPAQEQAMAKMYAYTSDEGGIRHALVDERNVDLADAKYMLVICAAFINLLTMRKQ
jgi:hypothetical protein